MIKGIPMTKIDDRYHAIKQGKKLLEDLCDPGKTPRVPSIVRERAKTVLKHFPKDHELDRIVDDNPELLDKPTHDDRITHIVR